MQATCHTLERIVVFDRGVRLSDEDTMAIYFDDFGNPLPRPKKEPEPDNADNEPAPEENADAIKED